MKKIYVSMTDKFLSGWGNAKSKKSKYIICCDNWTQADIIVRNAEKRGEMKYITTSYDKPYYPPNKYHSTYKNFNELGEIWTR